MAVGDGTAWNETNLDNDTNVSDVDDHILDVRKGVRLRMANEHVWPASQTGSAQAGQHTMISFIGTTAAPSTLISGTQLGGLAVVSSGTGYEFFTAVAVTGTTAGNDVPITFLGGLNLRAGRIPSQTAGDILYAADATSWSRAAIATTNAMIISVSGTAPGFIPASSAAAILGPLVTTVGVISAGTWLGTAIASGKVAQLDHGGLAGLTDADHPQYLSVQVSGEKVQRGTTTIGATTAKSVSFAASFANTGYTCVGVPSLYNTDETLLGNFYVKAKATASATFYNGYNASYSFDYIAIGT